jgi:hypothetical protein
MTTRLSPLEPPFAPDVAEDLGKLMPPGIPPLGLFTTVAHNPRVLRRFRRGGLLDPGSISPAQIAATVTGAADDRLWTPREQLILALCDALHARATVCDVLWPLLAATFTPAQIVELVVLAGQYHMVSFTVNALALPLEPMALRFPRAATRPAAATDLPPPA